METSLPISSVSSPTEHSPRFSRSMMISRDSFASAFRTRACCLKTLRSFMETSILLFGQIGNKPVRQYGSAYRGDGAELLRELSAAIEMGNGKLSA